MPSLSTLPEWMSSTSPTLPNVLSEDQCDQIARFFQPLSKGTKQPGHFYFSLPEGPALSIKYGDEDLAAEASTQFFFHALSQRVGSAQTPGIPAVYNVLYEHGYYLVVTEKVDHPTLEACKTNDEAVKHAASAVKWLFDQLDEVSPCFGRIPASKARVCHFFFKERLAPVPFANPEAVAKYINKAISRLPKSGRETISLSNEITICHSRIRKDNFLFDDATGRIWIVNFKNVNVLTKPFQQIAFFNDGTSFAKEVGTSLGYQPLDGATLMARVSQLLGQSGGDATFGLDEFGEVSSTQK